MSDIPVSQNQTKESALLWSPGKDKIEKSHLHAFAKAVGQADKDYAALWRWSVNDIEGFWSAFWDYAEVIGQKGQVVLKDGEQMPGAAFFPEASLNWAENMLKRRDDSTAIIFRDERNRERQLSFDEVSKQVSSFQQYLKEAGVTKGDRVAGFMPNIPETIIAAVATASLGAIWSSASPDFGVQGLLDRFGQIEPKILISVDAYYYGGKTVDCLAKIKEVCPQIPSIDHVVIVPFVNQDVDVSDFKAVKYPEIMADHPPTEPTFLRVDFNHPLFIMFSSGTTGIPKCIIHGHGGTLLQHMKEHQLHCDIKRDDRVFYFTTCGWMMWNWQISALASGATLLLYDGSPFYPKPEALWDYTSAHKASLFGTGAKYIDALKSHGLRPGDHFNLSDLKTITSTGSPLVHESFDYVYDAIKSDVHLASISGGTDIVSCFVLGNPISPVYRGEIQGPGLALAMDVFDDNGKSMPEGAGSGEMVCTKPFPSMPVGFWNDLDGKRYHAAYFDRFPNVWCHGDWIERTQHDGFIIHGRSDATLNPGGVRIGTAEIYRQVEQVPEVLESIAVGQNFKDDERVILFVRLKDGADLSDELISKIKKQIKDGASPRHVPAKVIQVTDIPRTKSNKIVELAVREVIHGRPVKNIESLANPEALEQYKNLAQIAG